MQDIDMRYTNLESAARENKVARGPSEQPYTRHPETKPAG